MTRQRAGALGVAVVATAAGVAVLVGTRWVEGEAAYAGVGPRAFPALIGTALTLAGIAFGVGVARGTEPLPAPEPARWAPLAWIVVALALAIGLVQPLGFTLVAALVFTLTARAFGSRRVVRDALAGLGLGVVIHVVFARALGVSLPGGPFG